MKNERKYFKIKNMRKIKNNKHSKNNKKLSYEKPTVKFLGKVSNLVKGGGSQSSDGAWTLQNNPIS